MKDQRTPTQKKIEVLQQLSKCYGIVTVACRIAKIGRTSYYEYINNDSEFAFNVNEIQESFVDYVETRLLDLIRTGDRTAIFFYLKAKGKNRGYS